MPDAAVAVRQRSAARAEPPAQGAGAAGNRLPGCSAITADAGNVPISTQTSTDSGICSRSARSSAPRGSGAGSRDTATPMLASYRAVEQQFEERRVGTDLRDAFDDRPFARAADGRQRRTDGGAHAREYVAFERRQRRVAGRIIAADFTERCARQSERIARPQDDRRVGDGPAIAIERRSV